MSEPPGISANPAAYDLAALPHYAPLDFRREAVQALRSGWRLCALFARPIEEGFGLCAVLADDAAHRLRTLLSGALTEYPALTPQFPAAHLFERELFEAAGILPAGHPWLKPVRRRRAEEAAFFRVDGEEVHEVGVGPVHAGIIEPGHFRFQCHGEVVHHLEIQLGYQHRGIEALLAGAPAKRGLVLAESIAGDSAVGHSWTHALAQEALCGAQVPPRASAMRLLGLELERLANHVGDLGALSSDVGYLPAAAHLGRLRGEFLNLLTELIGNRYGRGLVQLGGAGADVTAEKSRALRARLAQAREELEDFCDLLFGEPSVHARFEETGVLQRQAAVELGLVGPAARACGVRLDVRQDHPWDAYRGRRFAAALGEGGDVLARAALRHSEARQALTLLEDILSDLPGGPLRSACPPPRPRHLAIALVEGWRGELLHASETDAEGRARAYKVVDPSFHNWIGLALSMRGGEISDFPLCNKSFNLSYAGHDL